MCGQLVHTALDTHEMQRPRGAENFLHRSLSMSTCMVKPHHWKHILPHHVTLWLQLSWAALFPMAEVTQTVRGVRPQPSARNSTQSYPVRQLIPHTDTTLNVCACVGHLCGLCICIYMHVKCA